MFKKTKTNRSLLPLLQNTHHHRELSFIIHFKVFLRLGFPLQTDDRDCITLLYFTRF